MACGPLRPRPSMPTCWPSSRVSGSQATTSDFHISNSKRDAAFPRRARSCLRTSTSITARAMAHEQRRTIEEETSQTSNEQPPRPSAAYGMPAPPQKRPPARQTGLSRPPPIAPRPQIAPTTPPALPRAFPALASGKHDLRKGPPFAGFLARPGWSWPFAAEIALHGHVGRCRFHWGPAWGTRRSSAPHCSSH